MNTSICRAEKLKTAVSFNRAYSHNYRINEVPNADPAKTPLNEELVALKDGQTYQDAFKERIKDLPYAPRRDAVRGIGLLLAIAGDEKEIDEEHWKKQNVRWLQDTFGKENVISAVLHKDETTPHIHAVVIPVVNGRLSAKHYLGGKKAMSTLQTSYASYMAEVGLERGIKHSRARHVDIGRYYALLNKEIARELPAPEAGEGVAEYRIRANQVIADLCLKHFSDKNKADRALVRAKNELANARYENEVLRKNSEIDKLEKARAARFSEILRGLRDGYFSTKEQNDAFLAQMKAISDWVRARDRDREAEER